MNVTRAYSCSTALHSADNRYHRSNNFFNTAVQRNLFTFFIKPHLAVIGLHKRKQIIYYSIGGKDEETEAYIWSLRIKNKYGRISRSVKDGTAYLYFSDIGKELRMKWNIGSLLYIDQKWSKPQGFIAQHLHYEIVETIQRQAVEVGDIPAGETRLLYFLTTFKDANFARIMSHLEGYSAMMVGEDIVHSVSNTPLRLPLDSCEEFQIRFDGEDRGKKHIVHLLSYDDVRLD